MNERTDEASSAGELSVYRAGGGEGRGTGLSQSGWAKLSGVGAAAAPGQGSRLTKESWERGQRCPGLQGQLRSWGAWGKQGAGGGAGGEGCSEGGGCKGKSWAVWGPEKGMGCPSMGQRKTLNPASQVSWAEVGGTGQGCSGPSGQVLVGEKLQSGLKGGQQVLSWAQAHPLEVSPSCSLGSDGQY